MTLREILTQILKKAGVKTDFSIEIVTDKYGDKVFEVKFIKFGRKYTVRMTKNFSIYCEFNDGDRIVTFDCFYNEYNLSPYQMLSDSSTHLKECFYYN